MDPLVFLTPSASHLAHGLSQAAVRRGEGEIRLFPDGELYARIDSPLHGARVAIVTTMHPAGDALVSAMLLAETARDRGAEHVTLCAPYLAYLRHDAEFTSGEVITSRLVGRWLSERFDAIVTMDPHLHRYETLAEVYTVPTRTLSATHEIAAWIRTSIDAPYLIGPDAESEQWVAPVASALGCDFAVFQKQRQGDRDVSIAPPDGFSLDALRDRTPVFIDDIISTGHTMAEAALAIDAHRTRATCIAVHAVFSDPLPDVQKRIGAKQIVTCNTIAHTSNAIDIAPAVAHALTLEPVGQVAVDAG